MQIRPIAPIHIAQYLSRALFFFSCCRVISIKNLRNRTPVGRAITNREIEDPRVNLHRAVTVSLIPYYTFSFPI